jgi:hypothetical protein
VIVFRWATVRVGHGKTVPSEKEAVA